MAPEEPASERPAADVGRLILSDFLRKLTQLTHLRQTRLRVERGSLPVVAPIGASPTEAGYSDKSAAAQLAPVELPETVANGLLR